MEFYKKLVGEKVYLSPMNVECAELFTEWLNDFETTDYIGRSHIIFSLDMEKKYIEENMDKDYRFAIVEIETDKLLGTVSLEKINNISRTATLGVFIGDRTGRNQGYGTESLKLILDYGFNYLNLNNIKLDVISFNERAIRCYEKCGFKQYGKRRNCEYVDGIYYDRISMDILKDEFKEKVFKNRRNK